MKKLFLFIAILAFVSMISRANSIDTLSVCYGQMQAANDKIHSLQVENVNLKSEVSSLTKTINNQSKLIDSLKVNLLETNQAVSSLADSMNINISSTRKQIQSNSNSLNQTIAKKSQTGLWFFIALASIIALLAFAFGKLIAKRGYEVASLSAKADKLNEEIVNRLSNEMNDMQNISKQISNLANVSGASPESEQKLITTLADRITFMEMTLFKMDSSVRGHKQLSKSIKQMKDNLLANGYELVDMLGKDYHEGMKVTANFVEDEDLPQGKQLITGIIKPQINYKGKMIQSAQITVSQNI